MTARRCIGCGQDWPLNPNSRLCGSCMDRPEPRDDNDQPQGVRRHDTQRVARSVSVQHRSARPRARERPFEGAGTRRFVSALTGGLNALPLRSVRGAS